MDGVGNGGGLTFDGRPDSFRCLVCLDGWDDRGLCIEECYPPVSDVVVDYLVRCVGCGLWRIERLRDEKLMVNSVEHHNLPLDERCPVCLGVTIEYRHGVLSRFGVDTQAECRRCGTCWFVGRRKSVLDLESPCHCCGRSDG